MGGVFYVWLIPLMAVIVLSLGVFYLSIRRTWPREAEPKSPLEQAQELERQETQADQIQIQPAEATATEQGRRL